MEVVNLSKRKFNNLEQLSLPKSIINLEGDLFKFKYKGKEKLLKKLIRTDDLVFANKLYTLLAIDLYSEYIPDYFVIPEFLVSINRRIEAFAMPLLNATSLNIVLKEKEANVSLEEKKYYLKRIGEILDNMKNIREYTSLTDFYLGDLHEDNFVVDLSKKSVHVVDFDSCKIAGNKSAPAKYLTPLSLLNITKGKYKECENTLFGAYEINENTDLYCYAIVILNFLYGERINNIDITEFYNFINYLNDIKVDKHLLECFNKIVSNSNNSNPMDYIDTLTAEQVYRAKVYKFKKNLH